MQKLFFPVAAVIALAACQGNSNNAQSAAMADSLKVDSMSTEVLNIHDDGMAKMMVIRRLKTRTTEIADSLEGKKADASAYKASITLLDSANNAMNTWMHSYDMKQEGKSIAEKKVYLEAEKKKMSDVNVLMEQRIKEAKALLKEQ